ncbi:MAG: hypothetical protein V3T53_02665 [Phycisphaerales bacterium]
MNLKAPAVCLVVSTVAMIVFGCVERKVRITVRPEGTVLVVASFSTGSFNELYGDDGDAVPSLAGGWLVEDSVHVDDKGENHYELNAEAIFPPEFELPGNYAPPGDTAPDVYLQFPTTLVIEERDDGTYYHFHRKYVRRSWADLATRRRLLLDEPLEEMEDRKFEDMSPQEQTKVLRAFVDFEAAKIMTFARSAYLEVTPDAPQDYWLHTYEDLMQFKNEVDYNRLISLMAIPDQEERDTLLAQEAERWENAAANRLQKAIRTYGRYGGSQLKTFLKRYEWHKRYHKISEDLGDDSFVITVEMPGAIVASNADSVSGRQANWKFDGAQIRDRDIELMVTSRLVE